ncbi:MAG: 5'/3'-nucleotidase SurE [Marinilabiliaceae bacterium]|nr:5'/3'-nucleotidase SurE [Marinilabiliaceae bacterium]
MRILITNDDGYRSPGIKLLASIAKSLGEVYIVAPESGQSGKSHAITVCEPLKHYKVEDYEVEGVEVWAVKGTPVDCIKVGVHNMMADNRPDLILSGVNHGLNHSSSVHYSGTLGAAREGAMLGIPSIGISYDDYNPNVPLESVKRIVERVLPRLIQKRWNPDTYLNVNIPKGELKGIQVCRVGRGHWNEHPHNYTDPFGQQYTWLDGEFIDDEATNVDTDNYWLRKGYTTITPCKLDVTDYDVITQLKTEDL